MKILVIGDVHLKLAKLDQALEHEHKVDKTVFLSDFFDDFDDNAYLTESMSLWLKENLHKPNRVFLWGNHDWQYHLPAGTVYCSGYAGWKREIIEKILTPNDWKQFRYFHNEDNIWFSHAGVSRYWFEHPVHGIDAEVINRKIQETQIAIDGLTGAWGCVWAADRFRGGEYPKGGLLWNDWRNSDFFENVTQVVGHTPSSHVQIKTSQNTNSRNINVDTHMHEVIILDTENGSYEIISLV